MKGGANRGCIGLLVIIGIIVFLTMSRGGASVSNNQSEPVGAPEPSSQQEQIPAIEADAPQAEDAQGEIAPIDEMESLYDTTINDVSWSILEVEVLGESIADELPAEGQFVGLRFEVTNNTEDPLTFVGLELTDAEGRDYSYSAEALEYVDAEEACEVEDLEPNTSLVCTAIYDVEEDATDLHVKLTDLNMLGGAIEELDLELDE